MARPKGSGTPILTRLLNKVVINEKTDCWEWQGGTNNIGYGLIRDEHGMRTVHRVSYEQHKGEIPKGLCVLHDCDNPVCANPNHLKVGTHKENTQDMIRKGRNNYFGRNRYMQGTCPHCGKTMVLNMLKRWHLDNCKHKPER